MNFSFILFNLEERNEYVLNLALSVCLEDGGDCEFVTSIFDNKALTKTPCSLNQGYKADGMEPFCFPKYSRTSVAQKGLGP